MVTLRIFFLLVAFWVANAAEPVSVIHIVSFDYPLLAELTLRQGTVELVLLVGPDGSVRSTRTVSGDGILAMRASKGLMVWRFSPCKSGSGECEYPMSIKFILKGDPVNASECKSEFQFDNPGRIVVTSQPALAIKD